MPDQSLRVDFYVLESKTETARQHFTCKIAEKAYQEQHRVMILTNDSTQSQTLNSLLWTFSDESFVPHALSPDESISVLIQDKHSDYKNLKNYAIVINLSDELIAPNTVGSLNLQRIIEIVDAQPEVKRCARNKYKYYREKNIELHSHTIK